MEFTVTVDIKKNVFMQCLWRLALVCIKQMPVSSSTILFLTDLHLGLYKIVDSICRLHHCERCTHNTTSGSKALKIIKRLFKL